MNEDKNFNNDNDLKNENIDANKKTKMKKDDESTKKR